MYGGYIYLLNAFQMQFDMPVMCFIGKFADDFKNIIIDKVAFTSIDHQDAVFRHLIQDFFQPHLIEEGYIAV